MVYIKIFQLFKGLNVKRIHYEVFMMFPDLFPFCNNNLKLLN